MRRVKTRFSDASQSVVVLGVLLGMDEEALRKAVPTLTLRGAALVQSPVDQLSAAPQEPCPRSEYDALAVH